MGTPEGKRPLGTPRRRWEDNIKMNSKMADVAVGEVMCSPVFNKVVT